MAHIQQDQVTSN